VPPETLVPLCHTIRRHIPQILFSTSDNLGWREARSNAFGKQWISLHVTMSVMWRDSSWEQKSGRKQKTESVQSSWGVMPCNPERGACHPHLQGRSQARNQQVPPKRRALSELKSIGTAVRTSNPVKWKLNNSSLLYHWQIFELNSGKKNELKLSAVERSL
jgi:hypothetical protein